jgi:hypothetical protein
MDEREANIDLLFRNGLKDYEVLPPQEVWDNIHPSIKVNKRSYILLKAAASITVLISLSFLAYILSRDNTSLAEYPVLTMNVESMVPLFSPPADITEKRDPSIKVAEVIPLVSYSAEIQDTFVLSANKTTSLSQKVDVTGMSMANLKYSLKYGQVHSSVASSQKKTLEIVLSDPEFMPETSTHTNSKRWSIGAIAAPTYYSTLSSDKSEVSRQLASSEEALMSYTGGVAIAYKMNKRLSVQSGLYYSSLGQEVSGISSYGGFQRYVYTKADHNFEVLTTSGPIIAYNPDVFLTSTSQIERISTSYTKEVFDPEKVNLQYINNSLIQNFSYLELPVVLRYKLIDKALDFNLIGGISYNLLVKNSVYATTEGGTKYEVGETRGLNPLTLSSSIGMGMEYSFANNLSFNLEPTFRYYLNPFDPSAISNNHPFTFGIFTGISYKF